MKTHPKTHSTVVSMHFISNEPSKRSLTFSVLSTPGLVSKRTTTFCSSEVNLCQVLQSQVQTSSVSKSHSWSLQPDCLCLLQTPRALFSNGTKVPWPFVGWYYAPGGRALLFSWFWSPLKAHLKQRLPHSRTPLHWNESKHSSTEWGAETG